MISVASKILSAMELHKDIPSLQQSGLLYLRIVLQPPFFLMNHLEDFLSEAPTWQYLLQHGHKGRKKAKAAPGSVTNNASPNMQGASPNIPQPQNIALGTLKNSDADNKSESESEDDGKSSSDNTKSSSTTSAIGQHIAVQQPQDNNTTTTSTAVGTTTNNKKKTKKKKVVKEGNDDEEGNNYNYSYNNDIYNNIIYNYNYIYNDMI